MEDYDFWYEYTQEEKRIAIEEKNIKIEFRTKLKGLINITGLFRWMDEDHDWWLPLDIIEIEKTCEIMSGYPKYETCRIVNDEQRNLYLRHSTQDIRGVDHYFVCQWGYDDSYTGYLLWPLKNNMYLKVNYNR